MTFEPRRLLAGALPVLFLCVTACSAPESAARSSEDNAPMANEPSADHANEPSTAAGATQEPQDQGVPDQVRQERNKLLVEQYLSNADRLRRQGDEASLEAARIELLKAQSIAPSDPRVQHLLEQVATELNLPAATPETFAEVQAQQQKIHEQRRKAEVRSLLDQGQQALADNDFRTAIDDFRRAVLNVEVGRYVAWGDLDPRAHELLDKATKARDAAEAEATAAARRQAAQQRREAEQADQARRRARVDGLMAQASRAFERKQFALSRDLAFQAMTVEPNNQMARDLHNAAIKAARETRTDEYYRQMATSIRRMKEEAESLRIPQTDILWVDQQVWDKALHRSVPKSSGATLDPDNQALRKQLGEATISGLTFTEEDGAYGDVVRRVSTITNIPMIITPEARETIDSEDLRLAMDVTAPISVQNFLNQMVSRSAELAWIVQNGVVEITTKAKAGGANYLDEKDVRDLVFPKTVFLPPTIRDIPNGEDTGGAPRTGGEGEDKTFFVELDTLVANIKDATDPNYWDSEGGGSIDQAESGYLLVTANPDMQARVDKILDDLRRFATTVVTIESKFLQITQNFLQQIGVDFRGLGGSGSKGTVAQLDDVTNGLNDNASRGLDNSGTQDPAASPIAGAFYNDGGDGDVRARSENFFTNSLGRALSTNGGATAAIVFLNDLQIQAIIRAVEKKEDVQELNGQNLTVLNNERGHVAIINQTAYVRDFNVEVAQAAFIADPVIDVIQDGVVLDVRPTISFDRKRITLDMQPTVADLVRPIATFSTSLAGTTQPVTLQLPQLLVRSFATTVEVPDGASVLIGGLRTVSNKERRAQIPILADIPLIAFFFKEEGVSDENSSLMVMVRATITDVKDVMDNR